MKPKNGIKKYFVFSCLTHLLLCFNLVLMLFSLENQTDSKNIAALQTYIYEPHPEKKSIPSTQKIQPKMDRHSVTKKTETQPKQHHLKNHLNRSQQELKSTQQPFFNKPLLKILHDAIAANQSYPETALELNQSGIVKIGFMLSPEGYLSQIRILRSSGFASIDEAAFAAVQSISPIKGVAPYLGQPEFIVVDVIFQPT